MFSQKLNARGRIFLYSNIITISHAYPLMGFIVMVNDQLTKVSFEQADTCDRSQSDLIHMRDD